jgi:hydrogenase nickel incorporation protein HypB
MKIVKSSGSEIIEIELDKNLFKPNEEMSRKNRELLDQHGVHAVDILGSIGSGKTSIVQQIIKHIGKQVNMAAIAGDLTTTIDADRIRESGGFVVQANTGKSCHLNSNLVKRALDELDLENLDVVLIENVGKIVVVSTTEGPYMVIKHPYILMQASVLIVNKIDMAAAMEVDIQQIKMDALKIKSSIKVVFTSAKTGEGIPELIEALNFPKV